MTVREYYYGTVGCNFLMRETLAVSEVCCIES